MALEKLPKECKQLCASGVYGLYTLKNNTAKYVMVTPKKSCCNPEERHYYLDEEGNVIGEAKSANEYIVDEVVRLQYEKDWIDELYMLSVKKGI
jgi:hypothetical protein